MSFQSVTRSQSPESMHAVCGLRSACVKIDSVDHVQDNTRPSPLSVFPSSIVHHVLSSAARWRRCAAPKPPSYRRSDCCRCRRGKHMPSGRRRRPAFERRCQRPQSRYISATRPTDAVDLRSRVEVMRRQHAVGDSLNASLISGRSSIV